MAGEIKNAVKPVKSADGVLKKEMETLEKELKNVKVLLTKERSFNEKAFNEAEDCCNAFSDKASVRGLVRFGAMEHRFVCSKDGKFSHMTTDTSPKNKGGK